ncbi:MAG: hypothetical protein IPM55_16400 [Acidobacteria bacterium]|nr:hypothetical protein [Acidobacteriota bacterium]
MSQPQSIANAPSTNVQTGQSPTGSSSSAKLSISVPGPSVIVTQTLKPGRDRDAVAQPGERDHSDLISIPPGASLIRLRLDSRDAVRFTAYRVTLMTAEGRPIRLPTRLHPEPGVDGQALVIELPATLLARGDYVLTLIGIAESGDAVELNDYYFTVLKR